MGSSSGRGSFLNKALSFDGASRPRIACAVVLDAAILAKAMGDPAQRRATYDDLRAVPDHLVAEILNGVLVTQPRPASLHARAASRLGIEIGGPFDRGKGGPGGWVILDELELHLHGDVVVPDLAGWRRARMPEIPDATAFELAPDWVCEVLSPSTSAIDRAEKMPIYARERVGHAWLVDPIARTLEAYVLDEAARWVQLGAWRDESRVRAAPFAEVELELGALWAK
jgi:Uma2 family endonuclease